MRLGLAALILVPLLSGCVAQVPLRGSSYEHIKDLDSRVVLPIGEAQLVEALSGLLAERGFQRTDKREVHGTVTYYIYKGRRRTANSVRGSANLVVYESHELGSWFLARVAASTPSTTEVLLLGKPTVDGQEICADSDALLAEASYWCRDTKVRTDSVVAQRLHGGEEAETVRGVLSSLKERYGVR